LREEKKGEKEKNKKKRRKKKRRKKEKINFIGASLIKLNLKFEIIIKLKW
jgi:hypothetical protein